MRRMLLVSAFLGILVFAGASTALAHGPYYRPPAVRYGYGRGAHGAPWQSGYRGSYRPYCAPRRRVVAYPAYGAYPGPGYGAYPQLGFGIAGRNFSFWAQR